MKIYINLDLIMKKIIRLLTILVLFLLLPELSAQNSIDPRAKKGGDVTIEMSNIPQADAATVNRKYTVDLGDGTINMPYLGERVRVVGLTARQLENLLVRLYVEKKIYSQPIVAARVTDEDISSLVTQRTVLLTGKVGTKQRLPYRDGMTLLEALLESGDITDFGSRKIQVTRRGVTRTYDYYSARDRAIKLYPNDSIHVPDRGFFEGRPSTIGP